MSYYIIPEDLMDAILYFIQEDILSGNLDYRDNERLKTLNVEDIHANKNDAIENFIGIFSRALENLEGESYDEEEGLENRELLHKIIESLNKRKDAINKIVIDVLKNRENCCLY